MAPCSKPLLIACILGLSSKFTEIPLSAHVWS